MPITAHQIVSDYKVTGELAIRLTDLLTSAKDTYDTLKGYQNNLGTAAFRSARSVAGNYSRYFKELKNEWDGLLKRDHECTAAINWHATYNSSLPVKGARGLPPDVIGGLLGKLEAFMSDVAREVTPA